MCSFHGMMLVFAIFNLVFAIFNLVSALDNNRYKKIIEHSGIFNGQDFLTLSEYTDNMAKWAGYKVWQYRLWSLKLI